MGYKNDEMQKDEQKFRRIKREKERRSARDTREKNPYEQDREKRVHLLSVSTFKCLQSTMLVAPTIAIFYAFVSADVRSRAIICSLTLSRICFVSKKMNNNTHKHTHI